MRKFNPKRETTVPGFLHPWNRSFGGKSIGCFGQRKDFLGCATQTAQRYSLGFSLFFTHDHQHRNLR